MIFHEILFIIIFNKDRDVKCLRIDAREVHLVGCYMPSFDVVALKDHEIHLLSAIPLYHSWLKSNLLFYVSPIPFWLQVRHLLPKTSLSSFQVSSQSFGGSLWWNPLTICKFFCRFYVHPFLKCLNSFRIIPVLKEIWVSCLFSSRSFQGPQHSISPFQIQRRCLRSSLLV